MKRAKIRKMIRSVTKSKVPEENSTSTIIHEVSAINQIHMNECIIDHYIKFCELVTKKEGSIKDKTIKYERNKSVFMKIMSEFKTKE